MTYSTERARLGRQPLTIVELLLDDATPRRFSSVDITAWLPPGAADLATAWAEYGAIPCLRSVSEVPVRLDPKNPGIGTRATVSVSLQDFPHPDGVGWYFARLKASGQYVENRVAKVYRGFLSDPFDWSNFQEETWIISALSYPDESWRVQLTLRDVLDKGTADKTQAPIASRGKLRLDIASGDPAAFVVDTEDDTEYTLRTGLAYGYVRIDDEIIRYTAATPVTGGVSISGLERGAEASTTDQHSAGASVQWCLPFDQESSADIIAHLYEEYSDIDPAYIDVAEWKTRLGIVGDPPFSTVITEPTSVNSLVNELCQHIQGYVWWDHVEATIRLLPLTPALSVETLDTRRHIIGGSISIAEIPDERISRCQLYYAQRLRTEELDKASNYSIVDIVLDTDSETNYLETKPRSIWSRWLTELQSPDALGICARYVSAYGTTPVAVSFQVDAKDARFDVGDVLNVEVPQLMDASGTVTPLAIQITTKAIGKDGTVCSYSGQNFSFARRYGVYAPDTGVTDLYADATESERLEYCYYSDDTGELPGGDDGYLYF